MTTEYSIQKMVSDGTLSTIALGIQYLQRNDIYIRIAGEETPQSGAPSGYTWSFLDNTTLKILPVVPNGVEVVVYRRTDVDAMYNIYSQNAQFDEATIDENNQQLLYIAQEYLEQGIPGAGVDTIEFVRDDGINTYYRIKRTDGSYSDEFYVPSAGSITKVLARESLRRSYAEYGYNLVDGSFEDGGTLTSASDVLLDESTGKAYSGAGPYPQTVDDETDPTSSPGFTSKHDAITVQFASIQDMITSKTLLTGQKARTGSTTWKITSSNKGWPLDNGTQYATPLNGVWVEDAGADATGESDSYAAIMYVINKYNADTRRRFSICFGGGYYKTSGSIALHASTSDMGLNFGGAVLEATANMPSLISCPGISGLRLKAVKVQHSVGVTITDAMIHINTEAGSAKTTRHRIGDISSGLITGAPLLLLCNKMWESEIGRIRCDRDVTGKTGEIVRLQSCVNNVIQAGEIGYCATAWRLNKHPDVGYGCEGITFNGGVTAYAKTPMAIDNGTAIRLKGMVLDFCETSGPTFSNGQDVTIEGCWIANDVTSASWNGFIALPSTKFVKISGCHFVNNSPNPAFCASLNVPESSFIGNTAEGCQPGFRYASGVQEYGNQYGINGVGSNFFSGASFTFDGDPGIAPSTNLKSGISAHSPNQLLQRVTLSAPSLHPNNVVQIDHFEGNFADVPVLKLAWNGAYKYLLDGANIHLLSAGGGIVLTSPDGLVTKTLRLSNAGAIELI